MNKYEKNIKDIITYVDVDEIVDIFLDKLYNTDKTVALISDKEIVTSVMNRELISDDCISIQRVDLELDDAAYMISIDNRGRMVVQPIEYYDDKYFKDIEYAFVDMDGCVEQMTIDNLLDRDVKIVLFGYDDECECDECECACRKDEKPTTASTAKSTYKINNKEVSKEEFDKKYEEFEEMYLDNIRDMLLSYCEFMDEVNDWRRRMLRW